MIDGPIKAANDWAGQLKGWFYKQPAVAEHVPPSEHTTHGARENEQLAEVIGLLAHLIQLFENTWGRPRYPPVLASLAGQTSVDVTEGLPVGHVQIDNLVISSDTAVPTVTITVFAPSILTGSQVIYQGSLPTGMPPAIPLNYDLPMDVTRINIACSAAPTHAYAQFLCSPVTPYQGDAYPYAR